LKRFIHMSNASIHTIISILLILISSVFFTMSAKMKVPKTAVGVLSPASFPMILAVILFVLSLILMVQYRFKTDESSSSKSQPDHDGFASDQSAGRAKVQPIVYMAASLVYLFVLPFAGFTVSTVLFLVCMFHWIQLSWIKRVAFISGTLVVHYFFFDALLHIRFSDGIFGF
jgi:hypothetical protein